MIRQITPYLWVICLLLVQLYLLVSTRFTLWPEMVVYPYLLNNGFYLYKDIINPYTPIFAYLLSFFSKSFGYLPPPYQILTWSIILATDLLIFVFAKKLFKSHSLATLSLVFFLITSIPFGVNGLWYDLVQTPLILISFYFAYQFLSHPKKLPSLLLSSIFLSLAFFIKQQTVWFYIWLVFMVFQKNKKNLAELLKSLFVIFFPLGILGLSFGVFFYYQDNLKDFVFWTVNFPFFQASKMPGYFLGPTKHQLLVVLGLFLLFLPTLGSRDKKSKSIIYASFFLAPFAYPRFDYFHLIPLLAVSSLAFGQNIKSFASSSIKFKAIFLLALIFMMFISARFTILNFQKEVRFFEPDIYQAATLTKILSTKEEKLFIQNGPDQVFVIAERLPTKPWAIQFPWYLEIPKTQERILEGIKKENPRLVVYKPYQGEGEYGIGAYKPKEIANYFETNYQDLVQITDTLWLKVKKDSLL